MKVAGMGGSWWLMFWHHRHSSKPTLLRTRQHNIVFSEFWRLRVDACST
jgi:hypothetical protein